MTQAVAHLLEAAEQLSAAERAELVDLLDERCSHEIPEEIEQAHLAEVRRRIEQVERGEVELIPFEQVQARARALVEAAGQANR